MPVLCRLQSWMPKMSPPGHLVPSLWDLHMFYLLRPIFFRTCRYFTGLCSSNIPRYFLDFAFDVYINNLGFACVLMLRLISPELDLIPDVWVSNIPRYFNFSFYRIIFMDYTSAFKITICIILTICVHNRTVRSNPLRSRLEKFGFNKTEKIKIRIMFE